jgi:hypothetical protein
VVKIVETEIIIKLKDTDDLQIIISALLKTQIINGVVDQKNNDLLARISLQAVDILNSEELNSK